MSAGFMAMLSYSLSWRLWMLIGRLIAGQAQATTISNLSTLSYAAEGLAAHDVVTWGRCDNVVMLNSTTFDNFLQDHGHVMVTFCASGFPECDELAPQLDRVATLATMGGLKTRLAGVDMYADSSLAIRFSLQMLPAVKYLRHFDNWLAHEEFGESLVPARTDTAFSLYGWLEEREDPTFDWRTTMDLSLVVNLAEHNFSDFIAHHRPVLVKFYSPSCGRSAAFAPVFAAAARQLRRGNRSSTLAEVDVLADQGALANANNVVNYPGLRYFPHDGTGGVVGPRVGNAKDIVDWIVRREEDVVKVVADSEQMKEWAEKKALAIMGFVKIPSRRFETLRQVAAELMEESSKFYIAVLASPVEKGRLSLRRRDAGSLDDQKFDFRGTWTKTHVKNWILANSFPSIGNFNEDHKEYMPTADSGGFLKACLVACVPSAVSKNASEAGQRIREVLLKEVQALAAQNVRVAWFERTSVASHTDERSGNSADGKHFEDTLAFSADTPTEPQLTLLASAQSSQRQAVPVGGSGGASEAVPMRYVLKGAANVQNATRVHNFLQAFFAGKLIPVRKSQPFHTTEPDANGMTTLVGDTFEDVAFAGNKDVFVKFYAPWCGQSKKLEPAWSELAKAVRKAGHATRGVVVAKLDASANECAEEVPSYPHLVLYPAVKGGKKEKMRRRIRYTAAARNKDELFDFLEANAVNLNQDEDESSRCSSTSTLARRRRRKQGTDRHGPQLAEL